MKKKNNVDDQESIFQINPFFSTVSSSLPEKPKETASPSIPPEIKNITTNKVEENHRNIRIKSNEIPGFSIKNTLKKNSDPNKEEGSPAQSIPTKEEINVFTQNDLTKYWKEYIESIPEKKILATSMQSCIPVLQDEYNIRIQVDNPVQQKEILAERNELTSFLSSKLHNSKIYLYVEIAAQGENKKALSPKDRFTSMLERNPIIEKLCSELELELD
jgi:hypothetical protein